ncbi:Pdp3p KNAG_0D05320 [Huiozyma naganishii CBS 8797]|uniref:PWWP domain-containing protein n=1 Tax=Huiozyma naganishii (strain ATCC MYA-139 / BCRC 22969 / CBS 8797 / KCTC 17520 / NBRC 10181 / NCYC 3082 / Yp74L-3) TaxID=1071383 RepID=J7R5Y1_HUIN7|nr:hypothetical protein KNAG_0D05320 [Kazachstania naganishii CBS 8797]CCK70270.1 hypothetical protein KNAG_0D05320 [Kazachstania naganishii CBS 8797]
MKVNDVRIGSLVLCKVGSFPAWPAVVFPQKFLSADVLRKRKEGRVAVCFFGDGSYYWETPDRLMALTDELAQKQQEQRQQQQGHNSELSAAFEEAAQYTQLHQFVEEWFEGRDQEELFAKLCDLYGGVDEGGDPFEPKPKRPPRARSTATTATANATKPEDREEPQLEVDPEVKPAVEAFVQGKSGKHHKRLDRARRMEIAQLFRRRIQTNLVQRDTPPTQQGLQESHRLFDKITENLNRDPPFFDLATLRDSKLYKLLRVVLADYNLAEFHAQAKEILTAWSPLILQLKTEKKRTKTTSPAQQ